MMILQKRTRVITRDILSELLYPMWKQYIGLGDVEILAYPVLVILKY